jgi:hypothetical protein
MGLGVLIKILSQYQDSVYLQAWRRERNGKAIAGKSQPFIACNITIVQNNTSLFSIPKKEPRSKAPCPATHKEITA